MTFFYVMCLGWTPYTPSPRLSSEGQNCRFLRYTYFYFFIYALIQCLSSSCLMAHLVLWTFSTSPCWLHLLSGWCTLAASQTLNKESRSLSASVLWYTCKASNHTRKYTLRRKKLLRLAWPLIIIIIVIIIIMTLIQKLSTKWVFACTLKAI